MGRYLGTFETRDVFIRGEEVSDHGNNDPTKFFEFPENISPRKKKIDDCNNLEKFRRKI